mmetsp:Transcript_3874/g.5968  ORF Transcript_3874/g.5968 Transcript_3874/m.5968 type:complete len:140 (-) Transcript_3874:64-483(-)
MGVLEVPCTARTTIGEIREKVAEWQKVDADAVELVCRDKGKTHITSRPRRDAETVEDLWADWDAPRRMMQLALWICEDREPDGRWISSWGQAMAPFCKPSGNPGDLDFDPSIQFGDPKQNEFVPGTYDPHNPRIVNVKY